jgi:hypothetical protein
MILACLAGLIGAVAVLLVAHLWPRGDSRLVQEVELTADGAISQPKGPD